MSAGTAIPSFSSGTSTVTPNATAINQVQNAYNTAANVAQTPFQPYSSDPNAFVAPINQQQNLGISGVNAYANSAQPYYGVGANMLGSGYGTIGQGINAFNAGSGTIGQGIGAYNTAGNMIGQGQSYLGSGANYYGLGAGYAQNAAGQNVANNAVAGMSQPYYNTASQYTQAAGSTPVANYGIAGISSPYYGQAGNYINSAGQMSTPVTQQQIQNFMSPYMKQVMDPTMAALAQQQGIDSNNLKGQIAGSGQWGNDRAGLMAAQLAGQQELASGQTRAGLLQQGYGQALNAAMQEQGMQQTDLARQLQAGTAMQGLGTAARGAYENQQVLQQADLNRQLQAGGQMAQIGTSARQAYENQQALQAQDLTRQLQAAGLLGQFGQGMGALGQAQGQLGAQMGQIGTGLTNAGTAQGQIGTGLTNAGTAQGSLGAAMGNLGTGAQTAGLQGAQAQIGAGTLQQQTQQAGLQALYNQYLQSQAYPFQTAQFGLNSALSAAPVYGSTTSQSGINVGFPQQQSFWGNLVGSDPALKGGVGAAKFAHGGSADERDAPEVVGKTFDGQNVYRYRLLNGPPQIGLMADEAGERNPDALGHIGGYKALDYARATDDAAKIGHALGEERFGGGVTGRGDYSRGGFADGGMTIGDLSSILAMQKAAFDGMGAANGAIKSGPYGNAGASYLNNANVPGGEFVHAQLQTAPVGEAPKPIEGKAPSGVTAGGLANAAGNVVDFKNNWSKAGGYGDQLKELKTDAGNLWNKAKTGLGVLDSSTPGAPMQLPGADFLSAAGEKRGGAVGHYAGGGDIPYADSEKGPKYFPDSVIQPGALPVAQLPNSGGGEGPGGNGGSGGGSGGSGLGNLLNAAKTGVGIASTLKDIGGIAAMALPFLGLSDPALKSGVGRAHYDEGGPVDDSVSPFEKALAQTLKFEGGFNPHDSNGAPSNRGINQAANPDLDVRHLTPEQTGNIYRDRYWNAINADKLPAALQNIAFDTSVIAGPGRAKQFLSQAGDDPGKFMDLREGFMNNLLAKNPAKYGPYEKAWANRNAELRSGLGAAAPQVDLSKATPEQRSMVAEYPARSATAPQGLSGLIRGTAPEGMGEKALDFVTSEKFALPLLAGLGAMTGSPSTRLLPSILQGLGAGAGAYNALGQQDVQNAQVAQNMALQNARLGLEGRRVSATEQNADTEAKRLGLTREQYERKMKALEEIAKNNPANGNNGLPTQLPGALPPNPAMTVGTPTPETKESGAEQPKVVASDNIPLINGAPAPVLPSASAAQLPASDPFWKRVDPQTNPYELERLAQVEQNNARKLQAAGADDEAKQSEARADKYRQRAEERWKSGSVMSGGREVQIPGHVENATNLELQKGLAGTRVELHKAGMQQAQHFLSDADVVENRMKELAHVYQNFQSGKGTESYAKVASALRTAGIPIGDFGDEKAAGYDTALKAGVDAAFKQMAEAGAQKAPATALRESLMTAPRPDNSPEANYKIITDNLAAHRMTKDLYRSFLRSGEIDYGKFVEKFMTEHPYDEYVKKARKDVPLFKGMTKAGTNVAVGETGHEKNGIPEALQKYAQQFGQKFGKHKTKDIWFGNGRYYNANGEIVDANGNPVGQ